MPKSLALEALADVGGPELAGRYAKLKKVELSQSCERIFAGDVIAEPEVKASALAWVPEAMRFAEVLSGAAASEELAPWEDEPGGCTTTVELSVEGEGAREPVDDAPSSGEFEQAA